MLLEHSTGESPTESMLVDQVNKLSVLVDKVNELSEKYDTLRNRCNNVLELGLKLDGFVDRITALEKKIKQVRTRTATSGSSDKKKK